MERESRHTRHRTVHLSRHTGDTHGELLGDLWLLLLGVVVRVSRLSLFPLLLLFSFTFLALRFDEVRSL